MEKGRTDGEDREGEKKREKEREEEKEIRGKY